MTDECPFACDLGGGESAYVGIWVTGEPDEQVSGHVRVSNCSRTDFRYVVVAGESCQHVRPVSETDP